MAVSIYKIMKKLIVLFVLLLSISNVFSQTYTYFGDPSKVLSNRIKDNGPNNENDYFFVANNVTYLVAYDAKDNTYMNSISPTNLAKKRNLFIYKRDSSNNWVKASDIIQTDYKKFGRYDALNIRFFNPEHHYLVQRGLGYGDVHVLKNNNVVLILTNEYREEEATYRYNSIIFLLLNADGMYGATCFEPLDKKTLPAETAKIIVEGKNVTIDYIGINRTFFFTIDKGVVTLANTGTGLTVRK
jgi:hypothetical protein